jgi:preprotein translocase subunit SecB
MAEDTTGNGVGGPPPTTSPSEAQQLFLNAQYIKDLSFENPRAPQTLIQQTAQPDVEINVDVKARNLGPDVFEVVLTINATARAQGEPVKNTPAELVPTLALVETPRIIFPFARAIIANATRDGGFPPLMINPIDFGELLRRQQADAQALDSANTALV